MGPLTWTWLWIHLSFGITAPGVEACCAPDLEIRLHAVHFADAGDLADTLNEIFAGTADSGVCRIWSAQPGNQLVILARSGAQAKIRALLAPPPDPPAAERIEVIYLEHARADRVARVLADHLSALADPDERASCRVVADAQTNAVILQARPGLIRDLAAIARALDRAPAQ